jgi:N-acetylmuramoyl-L-alanine amidase
MESSVKLAGLIQKQFRTTAKRIDKGVHQAGFLVLRATSMPSVLVELGYLNNPNDAAFLTTTSGVNALAKSIYNAFVAYYKK